MIVTGIESTVAQAREIAGDQGLDIAFVDETEKEVAHRYRPIELDVAMDPASQDIVDCGAADLYATGMSLADVAGQFGIDGQTVANRFQRAGVPVRARRGWTSRVQPKEEHR